MRFGLVGTGHWAREVHGPALAAEPAAELVGVWGRDPQRTAALGATLGTRAYDDADALFAEVDAVSFAVPPDVQASLAVRAAGAGCHLLLEKPVATSTSAAEAVVRAVDEAGVSSVVFLTSRFSEPHRRWLDEVAGGAWQGGWARWIASALRPGSPYATSAWRHEKGALWDVGPHALSLLEPALGQVERLTADSGAGDLVHLVSHHEGGTTATMTLTLQAPPEAADVGLAIWGPRGWSSMPARGSTPREALGLAIRELMAGGAHPCDVHYGAHLVRVLSEAEHQLRG